MSVIEAIGFFAATGLLSGLVAAIVARSTAERQISIAHITAERKAWRAHIRAKALEVHDAILAKDEPAVFRLQAEFRSLLNPSDPPDHDIVQSIRLAEDGQTLKCAASTFAAQIEFLLKHDWERAKLEAGWFLPRWFLKAKRLTPDGQVSREPVLRWREVRAGRVAVAIATPLVTLALGVGVWHLNLGGFESVDPPTPPAESPATDGSGTFGDRDRSNVPPPELLPGWP